MTRKSGKNSMESDISVQGDTISGQHQIPTSERLQNIQKQIEKVDQVLEDIKQLEMKGQVLQTVSNSECADNRKVVHTEAEHSDSRKNSIEHTKLDVEELVEIDRGLQYVKWLQVVEDISNQVKMHVLLYHLTLLTIRRPLHKIISIYLICGT